MNKTTAQIKKFGDHIFEKSVKWMAGQGLTFVMPAFYPQRGGILEDVVQHGGTAVIAGGVTGQQLFPSIKQHNLPFDTTGIEESPSNLKKIVSALPAQDLKGPVALFLEAPLGDNAWGKAVEEHLPQTTTVASNEQNLRSYFEEKVNLLAILKKAGLEKHIIPSRVIGFPQDAKSLGEVYQTFSNADGKLVIQACGPGVNESGGGYSTKIITSLEEFIALCGEQKRGYSKVATFVEGYNSNLSICVGNLVPSEHGFGAAKGNLISTDSRYSPHTLDKLVERGQQMGLSEHTIFRIVAPSTLKCVGDLNLTSSPTNGVGNIINYHFPKEISEEIFEIGDKIGLLMGLCGKVGLCGVDLIIAKDGHIYINEINDRQQGTTELTSLHCEKNNIPGVHRVAFLQNFGNLNDPETAMYMQWIQEHSHQIYEDSTKTGSPFYIKLGGKYRNARSSKIDLKSGTYSAKFDGSTWGWNLDSSQPHSDEEIDLTSGEFTIDIAGASLSKGQEVPKGTQILRLCGKAVDGSVPFMIDETGHSVLNQKWVPVVNGLYSAIFSPQEVQNKSGAQKIATWMQQKEEATQQETLQQQDIAMLEKATEPENADTQTITEVSKEQLECEPTQNFKFVEAQQQQPQQPQNDEIQSSSQDTEQDAGSNQ